MTDLVVGGVVREFVVAGTAEMQIGSVVREFVVSSSSVGNRLILNSLVREFVVGTPAPIVRPGQSAVCMNMG